MLPLGKVVTPLPNAPLLAGPLMVNCAACALPASKIGANAAKVTIDKAVAPGRNDSKKGVGVIADAQEIK